MADPGAHLPVPLKELDLSLPFQRSFAAAECPQSVPAASSRILFA